jgi:probable phosphoglycerate mutase
VVRAERAAAIGVATNNVAEYRGLIAGLSAALEIDPTAQLEVRMDSKLVVEQMSGRWKVKHPDMRALASEAAALVARFPKVGFTWVPREQNAAADALANAAMDAAAAGIEWSQSESPAVSPAAHAPSKPLGSGWGRPSGIATVTVLLRHGQTALSVDRRFSGVGADPELTEAGRDQAQAVAARLAGEAFDVVVSSPLRRARQTAEIAAARRPIEVDTGFQETDFGEWEGHTFAEVSDKWPEELAAWLADPAVAPPGGESFAATDLRVGASLAALLERHLGARLLIVSHVTPIKLLVRRALDAPMSALYRMHLELCTLTTIDWYADGPAVLRSLNA